MKKQISYLLQVFLQKLQQSRTFTLMILEMYILYIYTQPVIKFSEASSYPSAVWTLPFMFSNIYFLFLFMLGVIYYFSDVPFMQHFSMYQIIRTGRKRWVLGQIGSVILQSGFLMIFNFAMSILWLFGHCEWTTGWGKLLHTAALTNAADYYGFLFEVPYSAMQKYSPIELVLMTLVIGTLVISFIGILMFALSLVLGRIWAIAAAVVMVVMIYLVHNAHPAGVQKLSMFAPVTWMQTTMIGTKMYSYYTRPPLEYMIFALLVGILLLGCFIFWRVRYVEFLFTNED